MDKQYWRSTWPAPSIRFTCNKIYKVVGDMVESDIAGRRYTFSTLQCGEPRFVPATVEEWNEQEGIKVEETRPFPKFWWLPRQKDPADNLLIATYCDKYHAVSNSTFYRLNANNPTPTLNDCGNGSGYGPIKPGNVYNNLAAIIRLGGREVTMKEFRKHLRDNGISLEESKEETMEKRYFKILPVAKATTFGQVVGDVGIASTIDSKDAQVVLEVPGRTSVSVFKPCVCYPSNYVIEVTKADFEAHQLILGRALTKAEDDITNYKEGDWVECIGETKQGSGWVKGMCFKPIKTTKGPGYSNIFWPPSGGNGVYSEGLRLIRPTPISQPDLLPASRLYNTTLSSSNYLTPMVVKDWFVVTLKMPRKNNRLNTTIKGVKSVQTVLNKETSKLLNNQI